MDNTCINCHKEVDEWYRVNERGVVFCGDDCYEDYIEDNCIDSCHPYIDDYELIRSNYLDWLDNWESDILSVPKEKYLLKIDEMLDTLDEVFDAYGDYYKTEGDDGVFAREIYRYLLKFDTLQNIILQWRPQRMVSFHLSFTVYDDEANTEIVTWNGLTSFLKIKKANTLIKILREHVLSPNRLSFLFDSKQELEIALRKLKRKFKSNLNIVHHQIALVCDGDCSKKKFITESQAVDQTGWFFCEDCEQRLYPGIFPKEKLIEEIKFYDIWKNLKKQSKKPSWPFYLRKIKRSCRHYIMDYPDWIELNYDF